MLRQLTDIEKWQFFQKYWDEFQKTNEYKRLLKALEDKGIQKPYSENILYRTYYAGYYHKPFIES